MNNKTSSLKYAVVFGAFCMALNLIANDQGERNDIKEETSDCATPEYPGCSQIAPEEYPTEEEELRNEEEEDATPKYSIGLKKDVDHKGYITLGRGNYLPETEQGCGAENMKKKTRERDAKMWEDQE